VGPAVQQEQSRLGRRPHLDLLGHLQVAVAFPVLLLGQDLEASTQLLFLLGREETQVGNAALENFLPSVGKRAAPEPATTQGGEEEDHGGIPDRRLCFIVFRCNTRSKGHSS